MSTKIRHGSAPSVIVIGGGATGLGIARDAAMRGFKVTVVERGNLGSGTTGRFHGILHSGGRYAVNDHEVAAECIQENTILRRIIPSAITDTGGLFVAMNDDEAAHADVLLQACALAGIPTQEIPPAEALSNEPYLARSIVRAFTVPDGFVDGAELLRLNRSAAQESKISATFLTGHTVTGFRTHDGAITAVRVQDRPGGASIDLPCDYVINAAGVWAGRIASLADVPFDMVYDKGTMITFTKQLSRAVLNRCRPENDGDLLVPGPAGSILGTTARIVDDPDHALPTQEEVDVLLAEGAAMVPALLQADAVRVYAGVRPLIKALASPTSKPGVATTTAPVSRAIPRSFRVIDHHHGGVDNMISVIGGKVTLYRLMAEHAVDLLCHKAGVDAVCTTANAPIIANSSAKALPSRQPVTAAA